MILMTIVKNYDLIDALDDDSIDFNKSTRLFDDSMRSLNTFPNNSNDDDDYIDLLMNSVNSIVHYMKQKRCHNQHRRLYIGKNEKVDSDTDVESDFNDVDDNNNTNPMSSSSILSTIPIKKKIVGNNMTTGLEVMTPMTITTSKQQRLLHAKESISKIMLQEQSNNNDCRNIHYKNNNKSIIKKWNDMIPNTYVSSSIPSISILDVNNHDDIDDYLHDDTNYHTIDSLLSCCRVKS